MSEKQNAVSVGEIENDLQFLCGLCELCAFA
jgi:hypothetical protein